MVPPIVILQTNFPVSTDILNPTNPAKFWSNGVSLLVRTHMLTSTLLGMRFIRYPVLTNALARLASKCRAPD